MNKKNNQIVFQEIVRAARLWPIWLRIGIQDIRSKYRRSVVGASWIFLNLGVMVLSLGVIYSTLLGQDIKKFLPFLTIGLIAWGYLTSSIVEGGNAFIGSEGYIKQIGLPLYVYVFRFFVSITVTMLISLPAYLIVAVLYGVPLHRGALWFFPGILLLAIISFLMIAIFSHLNARFRDASHLASIGLQVMFYITPIIWPAEMIRNRGWLHWVIDFNPFYHLLELVRQPLLNSKAADVVHYAVAIIFIMVLALVAWLITKHNSQKIAYLL